MARKWTFKEDLLVGKFCFKNLGYVIRDRKLDELMQLLSEHGFNERSKNTVQTRANDYTALFYDEARPYASNQVKSIAKILSEKSNNEFSQVLARSIKEEYNPSIPVIETIEEAKSLQNLSGINAGLNSFIHNIDFNLTLPGVLEKYIDKKGFKKHAEIYKPIFMKADTFSSILRGKYEFVKKENVLRLCVGLKLNVEEAEELLDSAGFSFSKGLPRDIVVKTALQEQCYDPFAIDIELEENNTPTLFSMA